jgi:hypothetical protein
MKARRTARPSVPPSNRESHFLKFPPCREYVRAPEFLFPSEPADGESEPNYWLGYSSGPRLDQHPPSLRPTKKEQENPTWEDSSNPEKARTCQKPKETPETGKTVDFYPKPTETESSSVPLLCNEDEVPVKRAWP